MDPLLELDTACFKEATEKFSPEQLKFIQSKWEPIRDCICQNAGFKKWGPHLLKLDKKSQVQFLSFFKTAIIGIELDRFKFWKENEHPDHVEDILRNFFDDHSSFRKIALTTQERLAALWKYDPIIISSFRNRFEQIFLDLFEDLTANPKDPFITQMVIGNLLSFYPYFDPPQDHEIKIVQLINQKIQLVSYRVHILPLVKGKIFAYGLTPLKEGEGNPILCFRGTPYPAALGFWEAILSDFHPFQSIGYDIFSSGKDTINHWIQDKTHVLCYGLSLGGTLAYHLGKAYGSKITVYAYGPPGIFQKDCPKDQLYGVAYHHIADVIQSVGYHPTGQNFKSYLVITELNRNFIDAHTRPAGSNPMLIIEMNTLYQNKKLLRHLVTGCKHGISLIFYLFFYPFYSICQWVIQKREETKK